MKVLNDQLLVEPWYDADRIGLIWLPDSAKNAEAQQGKVLAVGPLVSVAVGAHVMFHPFRGETYEFGKEEVFLLHSADLTAEVKWSGGIPWLTPLPGQLMIEPDWEAKYKQPSQHIYLPDTALEHNQPVLIGKVIDGPMLNGCRVLIEPGKGSEIGWGYDRKVYYFVRPEHILATLPDATDT